MLKQGIITALSSFLLVSLAGCSIVDGQKEAKVRIQDNLLSAQSIIQAQASYKNITISDTFFVHQLSQEQAAKPSWYYEEKEFDYKQYPIEMLMEELLGEYSVTYRFTDGIDRQKKVTVKHKGQIGEALKAISNASGYGFTVKDNKLTWSKYETRVMRIAMYPGKEEFGIGKRGQTTSNTGNKTTVINSESDYAHNSGELDVYTNLGKTLDALKTPDEGVVEIDPYTSSVLIKDYPSVVARMAKIIEEKNEILTTQVSLQLQIINVQIDESKNLSLDWNLIVDQLTSKNLLVETSQFASGTGSAATQAVPFLISTTVGAGRTSGTSLLIEALDSQGSVSTETRPVITTLNNRAAKLRNLNLENYVLESKVVTTTNVGTSSGLTQATVETGFSMYALPSIFKDGVVLRLTTNLSTLLGIVKKGSNGVDTPASDGDTSSTSVYVEAPRINDKDFDNSVLIPNGKTLLIAGFSAEKNTLQDDVAGVRVAGSSTSSSRVRIETIIAITPTVTRGIRG